MKIYKSIVAGFGVLALLGFVVVTPAFATQNLFPKTICHYTPGNSVSITFNNWTSYSNHLGQAHSKSTFDVDGACASATPSATPRATITEVCKPKTGGGWQWAQNYITPPNFKYEGPDTWNVTVKNAWCNAHAPSPSPSATASATPVESATPSAPPTPSETPVATESATPAPTNPPQTGGSDGRSDGHTESLGCLKPSDNCNTAVGGAAVELPSTGSNALVNNSILGALILEAGLLIRSLATKL